MSDHEYCKEHNPLTGEKCANRLGHGGYHQNAGGDFWIQKDPIKEVIVEISPCQDEVSRTIAERGKIYGDPKESHTNIGLSWTGLIQQHYGITLDHPIPPELVAMMMVTFKVQRSTRVYHKDNFVDGSAYLRFVEEFQKPKEQP